MRSFTPEVKRVLKENGCFFVRMARGDHEFWHSPVSKRSFVVDGTIKSRHTANEVMKQAGLEYRFR